MTDKLTEEALALGPKKLSTAEFQSLLWRCKPEERAAPDTRRRVLEAARHLESLGLARLPAERTWDRSGPVRIPQWVRLVAREKKSKPQRPSISWVPELAQFSGERDERRHAMLCQINEFLIQCSGHPQPVPEKERSLEIFGDEKRISQNLRGGLLMGVIDLSLIGAVRVHAPVPHEVPDISVQGRPLLVVENECSYVSFVEWNRHLGRYAAIAYGAGNGLGRLARSLDHVASAVGAVGIHYLGDIDREGIAIPAAASTLRINEGMTPVLPAIAFYEWLLEKGVRVPTGNPTKSRQPIAEWLPDDLHAQVSALIESGLRIPQESLGTIMLAQDFGCDF